MTVVSVTPSSVKKLAKEISSASKQDISISHMRAMDIASKALSGMSWNALKARLHVQEASSTAKKSVPSDTNSEPNSDLDAWVQKYMDIIRETEIYYEQNKPNEDNFKSSFWYVVAKVSHIFKQQSLHNAHSYLIDTSASKHVINFPPFYLRSQEYNPCIAIKLDFELNGIPYSTRGEFIGINNPQRLGIQHSQRLGVIFALCMCLYVEEKTRHFKVVVSEQNNHEVRNQISIASVLTSIMETCTPTSDITDAVLEALSKTVFVEIVNP